MSLLRFEDRMAPATLLHSLFPPTTGVQVTYGFSVAAAGKYVVVGALRDDTGATDAGSAYVYDLTSSMPTTPILTLNNPAPAVQDEFGYSVAIAGNYVVVGAALDDAGATDAGSVYVYDLSSITPALPVATLNNPAPAVFDFFGSRVAVAGNYVVVGAMWDDTGATDAGSVYVYDLNSMTPTVPIATLNNPTPAFGDGFGRVSVAGDYVVVGAPYDDTGATNAGSAYVYDLSSMTPTMPIATLNNPTPEPSDGFGSGVDVDGNYVVVGAPQDSTGGPSAGSAYVYDLNSTMPTTPIVTLVNPDPNNDDFFGRHAVAVAGNFVVVGAMWDDTGAPSAGSAYVYNLGSITPTVPVATLNNPTSAAEDYFGAAVAVTGTYVIVGAYGDDTQNTDQGAAYVYSVAAPRVSNVRINTGAQQRSRVTDLTVTIDQQVTFAGPIANAFTLTRTGGGSVAFAATASNVNGVTVVTLNNFTGLETEFDSLRDGTFTLTAIALQIIAGGQSMAANFEYSFHRLFGDADGNGTVSAIDFNAFRLAYGTSGSSIFDFDGNNQVTAADFNEFRLRYGMVVVP